MPSRIQACCAFAAIVVVVVGFQSALAGEWENNADLTLGTYYTTNACLVNKEFFEEESKVVGTFRPRLSVAGVGARSSLSLSAAAEYNSLADSSFDCPQGGQGFGLANRRPWVPSVRGQADLEVIEDWAELYVTAFASQNAINPFAAGGDDNGNAIGNTNVTYQWGTGLRIDRNLPNDWRLLTDVGYNEQYNTFDQGIGNSQEQRAILDLGKDPFAAKLSYGVRGSYSEIDFDGTTAQVGFSNKLSRAEIYSGLGLTDTFVLQGLAGMEENVFLSLDEDVDGSYWDLGFTWQPLSRVTLSAGYGQRFFGNTPRAFFSYGHKRSSITVSYSRDVMFPRNIRGEAIANGQEPIDSPVPEIPGDLLGNDSFTTLPGNGPVINDALVLNYSLVGRRTSFTVAATASEQTQLANGQAAEFQSVTASVTRRLNSKLAGTASLRWNRNEPGEGPSIPTNFAGFKGLRADVGVSWPLARSTSASLRYSYQEQHALSGAFNEFSEQRVTFSLTHGF